MLRKYPTHSVTLLGCCLILLVCACHSPESQLEDLQEEIIRLHAANTYQSIVADGDTLQLRFPPDSAAIAGARTRVAHMQTVAAAIKSEALSPDRQQRLQQLRTLIDSLAQRPNPLYVPAQAMATGKLMRHFVADNGAIRHPNLLVALLKALPEYYRQVHERPARFHARDIQAAVADSQLALDQMAWIAAHPEALPENLSRQVQNLLPEAQAAVKDFIGFCQSGNVPDAG